MPTLDLSAQAETPRSPSGWRRLNHFSTHRTTVNRSLSEDAWERIMACGYVAAPHATMPRADFVALYGLLDEFLYLEVNQDARQRLSAEAANWNAHKSNAAAYSGAPVGLVDRRGQAGKSTKIYLQLCREFCFSLQGQRGSSYYSSPLVRAVVDVGIRLAEESEVLFRQALAVMPDDARERVEDTGVLDDDLPIVIKFLAYHPEEGWATPPHFDKSVLTNVLNADDMQAETFRIGPYSAGPLKVENLQAPDRFVTSPFVRGTSLLFPGLLLGKIGVQGIRPTPHGVLPVQSHRVRHSAIAFMLLPNLDMSDLATTILDL